MQLAAVRGRASATHLRLISQFERRATGLDKHWFGRLELEWCERKILLGWLELELVAGVV